MTKQQVRDPKQKRSIEKKRRVIRAGYDLFCEKGYYKTNTAEIARLAGVSTGIVYSYFPDKKAILVEAAGLYTQSLYEQFQPLLSEPVDAGRLPETIKKLLEVFIASHTMSVEAHNEFMALALLEKDISAVFGDFENALKRKLCSLLESAGFAGSNLREKIDVCYGIAETVGHESIKGKHSREELNEIEEIAVKAITAVLNDSV